MNRFYTALAASVLAAGLVLAGLQGAEAAWGSRNPNDSFRASKIIGMEVTDLQGKKVGEIKDLMVDPQNPSRILFAVLSPSGRYDFEDRYIAIPMGAVSWNASENMYVLDVTHEQLAGAPSFSKNRWPNPSDQTWALQVHQYFGQPYAG